MPKNGQKAKNGQNDPPRNRPLGTFIDIPIHTQARKLAVNRKMPKNRFLDRFWGQNRFSAKSDHPPRDRPQPQTPGPMSPKIVFNIQKDISKPLKILYLAQNAPKRPKTAKNAQKWPKSQKRPKKDHPRDRPLGAPSLARSL